MSWNLWTCMLQCTADLTQAIYMKHISHFPVCAHNDINMRHTGKHTTLHFKSDFKNMQIVGCFFVISLFDLNIILCIKSSGTEAALLPLSLSLTARLCLSPSLQILVWGHRQSSCSIWSHFLPRKPEPDETTQASEQAHTPGWRRDTNTLTQ